MTGIPTVSIDQVPDPLPAGLTVLDVREPGEWAHGRIDGAVHIPLTELVERVAEVPT
ncbi:MAG: rhodanese-like domain-containing protein, partial [Marmoricola sp.]